MHREGQNRLHFFALCCPPPLIMFSPLIFTSPAQQGGGWGVSSVPYEVTAGKTWRQETGRVTH